MFIFSKWLHVAPATCWSLLCIQNSTSPQCCVILSKLSFCIFEYLYKSYFLLCKHSLYRTPYLVAITEHNLCCYYMTLCDIVKPSKLIFQLGHNVTQYNLLLWQLLMAGPLQAKYCFFLNFHWRKSCWLHSFVKYTSVIRHKSGVQ